MWEHKVRLLMQMSTVYIATVFLHGPIQVGIDHFLLLLFGFIVEFTSAAVGVTTGRHWTISVHSSFQ